MRLSAEHVVRFQGSSVATADWELRTQIPGPGKPSLQGAELPIQWRLRPEGGEPCGRTGRGTVWATLSQKGGSNLFFLPGFTLPAWLIPQGTRWFSLLQPNSLAPVSPSEAALSLCDISGYTCHQSLFSRRKQPFSGPCL